MIDRQYNECYICGSADETVRYCGACVTGNTFVLTGRGYVEIASIQKGDEVLGHDGYFHSVIDILKREYSGNILSINVAAFKDPLQITPEHPVLVANVVRNAWKKRYREDAYPTFLESIQWQDAGTLPEGADCYYPRIREVRDIETLLIQPPFAPKGRLRALTIPVSEPLMRIVGFYLAEGYTSIRTKSKHKKLQTSNPYKVEFTFGKNIIEFTRAAEIAYSLKDFGMSPYIRYKGGWRVAVHSTALASWLRREFGHGAENKKIPSWVKLLPVSKLKPLLDAYLEGDGHHVRRDFYDTATVSRILAWDIRDIALKIGYNSSVSVYSYRTNGIIEGRTVNMKPTHRVFINSSPVRKAGMRFATDECVTYRSRNGGHRPFKGFVYNLEVESSHSFVTPTLALHNCKKWLCERCRRNPIARARAVTQEAIDRIFHN